MKRQPYHLRLRDIDITVEHRKVKNLNLYIRPPYGEVLVTAPLFMDDDTVREFVTSKENWICTHRAKVIATGEKHIENVADRSVTKEQLQYLQEKIYLFAQEWEPVMGVHCTHWTIRDMTSRWGSCSVQKKTIRINLQLAKYPEECIEYVVVHELTHLLEASHNQVFKGYLKQFLPDYREREKYLAQHTVR